MIDYPEQNSLELESILDSIKEPNSTFRSVFSGENNKICYNPEFSSYPFSYSFRDSYCDILIFDRENKEITQFDLDKVYFLTVFSSRKSQFRKTNIKFGPLNFQKMLDESQKNLNYKMTKKSQEEFSKYFILK